MKVERSLGLSAAGVGVEACLDRLTPYGGLAAWSHYLERIGIVEDLARRCPVKRTSPNATPVRDVLHGFIVGILMGGDDLPT